MTHVRSIFTARNAALLGVVVLIGILAGADVALPMQVRVPLAGFLVFVAAALVLWNRIAPLRLGGVAHVPHRAHRHPRRR